jgi:hypothetical protein
MKEEKRMEAIAMRQARNPSVALRITQYFLEQ